MALPNIQRMVTDFLGMNQFGIDQVRSVEWGKRYLWAVRFIDPKPPKPFEDFFPATDLTYPEANLDSYNFELGQAGFKVPQRSSLMDMSITFHDDNQQTLLRWFKNWINIDILNDGQFISCLKDSHPLVKRYDGMDSSGRARPTRTLEFVKLNEMLNPIDSSRQIVEVYPDGVLEFNGSSGSEAVQYTVNFVIVGKKSDSTGKGNETGPLAKAKTVAVQTLGRFF